MRLQMRTRSLRKRRPHWTLMTCHLVGATRKTQVRRKIRFAPSTVEVVTGAPRNRETNPSIELLDDLCTLSLAATTSTRMRCKKHIKSSGIEVTSPQFRREPIQASPMVSCSRFRAAAFLVKRFGNAKEDASWFDGPNGQYAFLNVEVPFEKAVQHFSAIRKRRAMPLTAPISI